MVQWFNLLYKKLNIRGQWFEPWVLCYLFFYLFHYYFSFLFHFINCYYYNYFFLYVSLITIFPLLVSGVRVGWLCWVGQELDVLAAGRWWRLFGIISRVFANWLAIVRPYYLWVQQLLFQCGGLCGRAIGNFWCRGELPICIMVEQGHTVLAVGAGVGCFWYFLSLAYHFSFLSPSLWNGWMDNLWFKSFPTEF